MNTKVDRVDQNLQELQAHRQRMRQEMVVLDDKAEKLSLVFKVCELDDTGTYSVEITEFVKNGEKDQTDCWLEVEGRKYTFKYF